MNNAACYSWHDGWVITAACVRQIRFETLCLFAQGKTEWLTSEMGDGWTRMRVVDFYRQLSVTAYLVDHICEHALDFVILQYLPSTLSSSLHSQCSGEICDWNPGLSDSVRLGLAFLQVLIAPSDEDCA